jgi:hypothetical protein
VYALAVLRTNGRLTCCQQEASPEEECSGQWVLTSDHSMQPLKSHGNVIDAILDLQEMVPETHLV